jgi:hypothetical protein
MKGDKERPNNLASGRGTFAGGIGLGGLTRRWIEIKVT